MCDSATVAASVSVAVAAAEPSDCEVLFRPENVSASVLAARMNSAHVQRACSTSALSTVCGTSSQPNCLPVQDVPRAPTTQPIF